MKPERSDTTLMYGSLRSSGGWLRRVGYAQPPPAPITPAPAPGPAVDPPIWSVAPPVGHGVESSAVSDAGAGAPEGSKAHPSSRKAGTGLIVALLVFYLLQLLGGFLAWQDAEIRTPGQTDLMVGYALCFVLLGSAFLWRGRWRAAPVAMASLAGSALPVSLSRDLLAMLGIPSVWIGQSMTLHVLFPLVVGGAAVLVLLVRGSSRSR